MTTPLHDAACVTSPLRLEPRLVACPACHFRPERRYGDTQCRTGFMNCCTETSRRFSAKETPPAAARQSRNSTPMTVSCMCLPAFSSGMTRWRSSQETYVRRTLTSCKRLTARRRLCITLAVWRGGPARAERSLIILAWTLSSFATRRSPHSMYSSIQCRHDATECSRWIRSGNQ